MDLRELSGLDLQGARNLLFACTTDLKRHEKDINTLRAELGLWTQRTSLAESKGMAELAGAARARAAEITAKIGAIEESFAEIRSDISRLKEALPGIAAKERSIDPDRLLAELQLLTGELLDPDKARLERELATLSSGAQAAGGSPASTPTATPGEDALAALKRKMGMEH